MTALMHRLVPRREWMRTLSPSLNASSTKSTICSNTTPLISNKANPESSSQLNVKYRRPCAAHRFGSCLPEQLMMYPILFSSMNSASCEASPSPVVGVLRVGVRGGGAARRRRRRRRRTYEEGILDFGRHGPSRPVHARAVTACREEARRSSAEVGTGGLCDRCGWRVRRASSVRRAANSPGLCGLWRSVRTGDASGCGAPGWQDVVASAPADGS